MSREKAKKKTARAKLIRYTALKPTCTSQSLFAFRSATLKLNSPSQNPGIWKTSFQCYGTPTFTRRFYPNTGKPGCVRRPLGQLQDCPVGSLSAFQFIHTPVTKWRKELHFGNTSEALSSLPLSTDEVLSPISHEFSCCNSLLPKVMA